MTDDQEWIIETRSLPNGLTAGEATPVIPIEDNPLLTRRLLERLSEGGEGENV
jgi:hypothetical protein